MGNSPMPTNHILIPKLQTQRIAYRSIPTFIQSNSHDQKYYSICSWTLLMVHFCTWTVNGVSH